MKHKYVVAVSGGVDSVVLLHQLWRLQPSSLIVAHFDHGIRNDSADDAAFVEQLAAAYHLPFETKREELGGDASEEQARTRRYAFLRQVAQKHQATIVTAHHGDDVLETIVINIMRGTGWRGLAVLDSDIVRPLLAVTKKDILEYALEHGLEWQQDSTNQSLEYMRNKIRAQLIPAFNDSQKEALRLLWQRQLELKYEINHEVQHLLGEQTAFSRYFFTAISAPVALELLRAACLQEVSTSPTIPQRERALQAIKTYPAGKICQVGSSVQLRFATRTFSIHTD